MTSSIKTPNICTISDSKSALTVMYYAGSSKTPLNTYGKASAITDQSLKILSLGSNGWTITAPGFESGDGMARRMKKKSIRCTSQNSFKVCGMPVQTTLIKPSF